MRFISEPRMDISIPIRVPRRGLIRNLKQMQEQGIDVRGHQAENFRRDLKLAIKMAAIEAKWELTDKAVYVFIVANMGNLPSGSKEKRKKALELPETREPNINYIIECILRAMQGVLFVKRGQVSAVTAVKRNSLEDGIEIMIGCPKDVREMKHDLRNA